MDVYFSAFAIVNSDTIYSTPVMIHTAGSEGNIGPAGGYIVLDKGNYIDGWRYLEMAPINVSDSAAWGCPGVYISSIANDLYGNYLDNEIGTGDLNTLLITEICDDEATAADLVSNWSYGGYNDWFVPSIRELSVMINSCNELALLPNLNGSFWTSNEVEYFFSENGYDAFYVNTSSSYESTANRQSFYSVRPLRKSN